MVREHLKHQFSESGLAVTEQSFEIVETMWGDGTLLLETNDGNRVFTCGKDFVVNGRSAVDSVSAQYIVLFDSIPDSLYYLMQEKIVICAYKGFTGGRMPTIENMTQSGARAIIFIQPQGNNVKQTTVKGGRISELRKIPQLSINYEDVSKFVHAEDSLDTPGSIYIAPSSNRITLITNHYDSRLQAANIIGLKKGSNDRYIIVGAHYDTIMGPMPGANDNASGVAMMAALARMMKSVKTKHNILFIAFGGEEKGCLGSRHYVQNMPMDIDTITEMINLDMVGKMTDNCLYYKQFNETSISPKDVKSNSVTPMEGQDGLSDHYDFIMSGVPASVFHTGLDDQTMHTENDTSVHLNYEGMEQILEYLSRYICLVDSEV